MEGILAGAASRCALGVAGAARKGGGATSTSRSGKVGRGALWFAPTSMYCP